MRWVRFAFTFRPVSRGEQSVLQKNNQLLSEVQRWGIQPRGRKHYDLSVLRIDLPVRTNFTTTVGQAKQFALRSRGRVHATAFMERHGSFITLWTDEQQTIHGNGRQGQREGKKKDQWKPHGKCPIKTKITYKSIYKVFLYVSIKYSSCGTVSCGVFAVFSVIANEQCPLRT